MKRKLMENQIKKLRKTMNIILHNIKENSLIYENFSGDEIHSIIIGELVDITNSCASTATSNEVCHFWTVKYLRDNLKELLPIINEMDIQQISMKELEKYHYKFDFKRNLENFSKHLYATMKETYPLLLREVRYGGADAEVIIDGILTDYENYSYKIIFEEYQDKLVEIARYLYKYNILQDNNRVNNRRFDELDLDILKYKDIRTKKEKVVIEDLCDKEFYKKMSLEEIIAYESVMINRFEKVVEQFMTSIFVLNNNGVFDKIREDFDYELDISDEDIINSLYQETYLYKRAATYLNNQSNFKILDDSNREGFSYDPITQKIIGIEDVINEKDKRMYNRYYINSKNAKEAYEKDLSGIIIQEALKKKLYKMKDFSLTLTLSYLLQVGSNINWGCVLQDDIVNDKYILVGIDFRGFNYPIRLHIKKSEIVKMLKQYKGNAKIPVYEGSEDFTVDNRHMSVQVFMPLQNYQLRKLKEITKKMDKNDERYAFLMHIIGMSETSCVTEYMKKNGCTGKVRREIDLETGKIALADRKDYELCINKEELNMKDKQIVEKKNRIKNTKKRKEKVVEEEFYR